jgi:hypothetical protein
MVILNMVKARRLPHEPLFGFLSKLFIEKKKKKRKKETFKNIDRESEANSFETSTFKQQRLSVEIQKYRGCTTSKDYNIR